MRRVGSKLAGLAWIAAGISLAALCAVRLPQLAKHVPWTAERWFARVLGGGPSPQVRCGTARPEAAALLQQLVRRIYPLNAEDAELPITVDVIHGDTVNAFASLGGQIYVFDGLLKQADTPDELAGILAHEIEHVKHRHVIQDAVVSLLTLRALSSVSPSAGQVGKQVTYRLLTLSFNREQEAEADEKGLERLRAASIDAQGFRDFFLRAKPAGSPFQVLSSHPDNGARAELASHFRGYPTTPVMGMAEWRELKMICH